MDIIFKLAVAFDLSRWSALKHHIVGKCALSGLRFRMKGLVVAASDESQLNGGVSLRVF